MTIEEAIKALKEGKKIRRKTWEVIKYIQLDKDGIIRDDGDCEATFILKSDSIVGDVWEIFEEPILDKQEKKYLENFLRPFTKRYDKILIAKASNEAFYWLDIDFYTFKNGIASTNTIELPTFGKGEHMYEGMKEFNYYTLEELGLFK